MKLLHGLCAAFAMYSALPTPQIAWGGDSLRWALACFPLVGAVLGGLFWGWGWLASWLGLGAPLTAAVWLCLIVGVSGGIHLDGFCDTADALASHQPAARKLEILKDSHVGAFAVIGCGLYLLLYFALLCELPPASPASAVVAVGFIFSRAASALGAVTLRGAKQDGTLATFSHAAEPRAVILCSSAFLLLCAAGMLLLSPFSGVFALLGAELAFLGYRQTALRGFGGITGDLAGFWVCVCELTLCGCAVLALRLTEVLW